MKKLLLGTVMAAFALSPVVAMADHHEGGDRKGGKFQKFDTDGDGNISKAEFLAKHEERFSEMDSDGDGVISKDELKATKEKFNEKREEWKEKRQNRKGNE